MNPLIDRVTCGDCRELITSIEDSSIDLVLTSPPYYHQRNYGNTSRLEYGHVIGQEETVDEYIDDLEIVFRECLRVIKTTGSIVFNLGDKYENGSLLLVPYRFATRMTKCPKAKLINVITWVKPNPEPRQFKRRLISSTEPFFHFVKSSEYKYFRERFEAKKRQKPKPNRHSRIGQKYFELIDETTNLSLDEKRLAKKELMQIIDEVKRGEITSFRMKIRGIHSSAYGGYEGGRKQHIKEKGFTIIRMYGRPIKRDVIESPILNLRYLSHPAIYPERIIREILNLVTETGDTVLDPFLGSGTTAVVSKKMGRRFIGFEINPDYCKTSEERLNAVRTLDPWVM